MYRDILYCTGGIRDRLMPHDLVHCVDIHSDDNKWNMFTSLPVPYSHHSAFVISLPQQLCEAGL